MEYRSHHYRLNQVSSIRAETSMRLELTVPAKASRLGLFDGRREAMRRVSSRSHGLSLIAFDGFARSAHASPLSSKMTW